MKGNETKVVIGMLVVAVLILIGAYNFFYSKDVAAAEAEQTKINELQVRLNELNEKNANRAMYESSITDSYDIIDTILALYGPGNTPEKTIMLVVDLCHKTGCEINNISFSDNKKVYESDEKDTNGNPEIQIYKGGMAINVHCGYTQFKKFSDYINSYAERMNLEQFNVGFNSADGLLTITTSVNMYHVVDKNHEYIAPTIEDIDLGTTNIFKTNEIFAEENLEGEENAEGTTETTTVDTGETETAE